MKDGLNFKDSASITRVTDSDTRIASTQEYIGRVSIWKNGEKIVDNKRNLIVETGKVWIAQKLNGSTIQKITKMKVGTSDTAPNLADTDLGTVVFTQNINPLGGTVSGKTTTYIAIFEKNQGSGDLKEIGLFADTVMVSRLSINFTKGANDKIIIEWILEPA